MYWIKKRYLFISLISIFFSISLILPQTTGATRVAVIGFESSGISWTSRQAEQEILEGLAQKYTEKLLEEDIVEVVDRSRVQEVLEQMGHKPGDSLDMSSAAQIGRLVDSNLLIAGSLEELKAKEEGEIKVGPLSFSGVLAEVELKARLIDVVSGDTLTTYSGTAEESETGIELSDLKGISFGSKAFADSAVGKAVDEALTQLVEDTVDKQDMFEKGADREQQPAEIEAEVMAKVGNSLVINKGKEDGVQKEQEGVLERKLDLEDREEPMIVSLGEIEVTSVDDNSAFVSIEDPREEPKKGDMVTLQSSPGMETESTDQEQSASGSVIKEVETPDFKIYIDRIKKKEDKATVEGTAEARGNEEELTLLFHSGHFKFYDHRGEKRETSDSSYAKSVSIGNTSKSGKYNMRVTELVMPNYPQKISWSFDNVPPEADHLARLRLYFETPEAGEVEINLDGISF